MLPVCFLLAVACLQGSLLLEAGPAEPRKPFFERFRRLEEQVINTAVLKCLYWRGKASSIDLNEALMTQSLYFVTLSQHVHTAMHFYSIFTIGRGRRDLSRLSQSGQVL